MKYDKKMTPIKTRKEPLPLPGQISLEELDQTIKNIDKKIKETNDYLYLYGFKQDDLKGSPRADHYTALLIILICWLGAASIFITYYFS